MAARSTDVPSIHVSAADYASYHAGVLILRIPIAENAKPRKIAIHTSSDDRWAIQA